MVAKELPRELVGALHLEQLVCLDSAARSSGLKVAHHPVAPAVQLLERFVVGAAGADADR